MEMETWRFMVLLAEDDAVSRIFLSEAIKACGGNVLACADGPLALARARAVRFNLLILDQHLPGMDGDAILRAVRGDPAAAAHGTPAIATTAAPDTSYRALLAAGFAEVLPKPLTLDALGAALHRQGCDARLLDDAGALSACGSPSAVLRLRRLFAEQELPRIQREFEHHGDDHHALRPTLHRLRASCGFCGTPVLARASEALHHALALQQGHDRVEAALHAFGAALRETRAALRAHLDEAE